MNHDKQPAETPAPIPEPSTAPFSPNLSGQAMPAVPITSGPLDGAEVLDDVAALLRKYVVFPSEDALVATTLWVAHTHAIEAFDSTPRLGIISAEKQSGKTRLLELLELLVRVPMATVNMSPAVLFRSTHAQHPTLLIDEADTIFGPQQRASGDVNEDLRGILNAGHRRGKFVFRMEGQGSAMKPVGFETFAPAAMAGIGALPDTITDRAVVLHMRRRAQDEHVTPFRFREGSLEAETIKGRLADWVVQNIDRFATVPELPEGLTDRPADVWEPLVAVADTAGGEWPEKARDAAMRMVKAQKGDDGSWGVRLLRDIRTIYERTSRDRFASGDLAARLSADEEMPWGDLKGKSLDARALASRLHKYGIRPHNIRHEDKVVKGYELSDFHDAFGRYLTAAEEGETK